MSVSRQFFFKTLRQSLELDLVFSINYLILGGLGKIVFLNYKTHHAPLEYQFWGN